MCIRLIFRACNPSKSPAPSGARFRPASSCNFCHFFTTPFSRPINNGAQSITGSKINLAACAALTFTCQPCDWQYFAVTRQHKSFIARANSRGPSFITEIRPAAPLLMIRGQFFIFHARRQISKATPKNRVHACVRIDRRLWVLGVMLIYDDCAKRRKVASVSIYQGR